MKKEICTSNLIRAVDFAIGCLGDTRCRRAVIYHVKSLTEPIFTSYARLLLPARRYMGIPDDTCVCGKPICSEGSLDAVSEFTRVGGRIAFLSTSDSELVDSLDSCGCESFILANGYRIKRKAIELLESSKYDVIAISSTDYASAAENYGFDSKEALNALSIEAENFSDTVEKTAVDAGEGKCLVCFLPDIEFDFEEPMKRKNAFISENFGIV